MKLRRAVLPLLVLAAPVAVAGSADIPVPAAERSALSLTLHQDGPALIRERRSAALERGAVFLVLDGLPRTLRSAGVTLQAPGLTVLERRLEPATLTAERQLAAHLGKTVAVAWIPGGPLEVARVLGVEGVPLFEIDGRVTAGLPARIVYDSLAPDLSPVPVLRARVDSEGRGKREIDLSYAADGLSWTPQAEGELNGDRLTLTVWAELVNGGGVDFPEAGIRLAAGSTQAAGSAPMVKAAMRADMAAAPLPRRETAGPFHVYTLPRPVSLRDGASVQVPLLPPAQAAVRRELALPPQPAHLFLSRVPAPAAALHPTLTVFLINTKAAGLGTPLPAGPIRVTMKGPGGDPILLGEDWLPALPEGGEARLTLGQAFDVTARRVQTDFQKVSAEVTESAWEVRLANAGDRPETVVVRDAFRADWLIVDESTAHVREDAATPRWTVTVPAKGRVVLSYRVRVK